MKPTTQASKKHEYTSIDDITAYYTHPVKSSAARCREVAEIVMARRKSVAEVRSYDAIVLPRTSR